MVKAVIELWFDEVADAFDAVENAKDFYNDEKQSWLFEKATKFLAYRCPRGYSGRNTR